MIRVLVPSFRDGMLMRLFASMERSEPGSMRHVTVLDNGISQKLREGVPQVRFVAVPRNPFVFSVAFNRGVASAPPEDDIVCLGDDCEIVSDGWASALEALCDDWPVEYGLLTCSETTTSSVYGQLPRGDEVIELPDVALGSGIVMPRRVLEIVGPWDESLVGYGFDDFDYGVRLLHSGYLLGITGAVLLSNLEQAAAWVQRLGSYEAVLARLDINFARFHEKWTGAIPPKPWVVQRPAMADHFRRRTCACK